MGNKHYIYILVLVCLCIPTSTLAQYNDQNYVRRVDLLKAYESDCDEDLGDDEQLLHRKTWQFYDDLGRPTILAKGGKNLNGTYSVSMTEYDKMGRKSKIWSSFDGGEDIEVGTYSALQDKSSLYFNDSYGFSQFAYNSFGEPIIETGPGKAWHENDKKKTTQYVVNKANSIRKFEAPINTISLVDAGYYAAGTLIGKITTDEDGIKTETYKDGLGNIIMEKLGISNTTYYVYNAKNELRYVLSPSYQEAGYKDLYAYEYRYDDHSNIVKKGLPGCEMAAYWYNQDDQMVFEQDATLRERNLYRFFLYDDFGRMVIQGVCSIPNKSGRTNPCKFTGDNNSFCDTGYVINETSQFTNPQIEIVNYYDNYDFLDCYNKLYPSMSDSLVVEDAWNAKTYLTGRYQVASNGKGVFCVMYYDINGNNTDTKTILLDSHFVSVHQDYNFTNNVVTSIKSDYCIESGKLKHQISSKLHNYYDEKTGLLKSTTLSLQLANGLVKTRNIQEFSYDGTGKIQACKHGGNVGTTSYQYNIRGQFTDITSNSFTEKLYYTDGLGIPRYNGNISSQQWKTADETIMRGYKFSYDNCNRLTNSIYEEREDMSYHLNRYNEEIVTYNANGAIKKIRRRGRKDDGIYGKIDDLTINLHGNQLMSVIDKSAPVNSYAAMDFKDGADDTKEYFYNGVGALVSDANKGIAHISYDNLNHPREIQFTNGGVIRYVYAPDGTKLRATYLTAIENIVVPINTTLPLQPAQILSEDSVEYLGDEVYENGALSKYLFTDGYASLETNTPVFHYFTKDHLGNIRTVVNEQGSLEQVTHYYPFGAIFADAGINQALQPYKFNGKELDRMHGLDWYDYGARMYDPVICTWTTIDPLAHKYPSFSPYVFCANCPINIFDPNGKELVILGNKDQMLSILTVLQKLTNDNLRIDFQTGKVTLTGKNRWDNRNKKLTTGTNLIRGIINNKYLLTIREVKGNDLNEEFATNTNNSRNGIGTDANINFNKNRGTPITVEGENGYAIPANNISFLALGHELIHGYRDMKGITSHNKFVRYTFKNWQGKKTLDEAPVEELITTGIIGNYIYTDNKIRVEQGFPKRIKY